MTYEDGIISHDLLSEKCRIVKTDFTLFDDDRLNAANVSPRRYNFSTNSQDVLVFLHIQKTGGSTFGKHLVRDLQVEPPCDCPQNTKKRKRCTCLNDEGNIWIFSRFSLGWPCGLHADWTELHECVDNYLIKKEGKLTRRYLYITMLRDPFQRYLSEFKHVSNRGKEWSEASLRCNGKQPSIEQLPFCFVDTWKGVSLDDFISCDYNLAINRQTRMLASLSSVNCYNVSSMTPKERNLKLIETAKANLVGMSYFGLVEMQLESQYLFERTFNLKFSKSFDQYEKTHAMRIKLTEFQKTKLNERIRLDEIIYNFAKTLFTKRLKKALQEDGLSSMPL